MNTKKALLLKTFLQKKGIKKRKEKERKKVKGKTRKQKKRINHQNAICKFASINKNLEYVISTCFSST